LRCHGVLSGGGLGRQKEQALAAVRARGGQRDGGHAESGCRQVGPERGQPAGEVVHDERGAPHGVAGPHGQVEPEQRPVPGRRDLRPGANGQGEDPTPQLGGPALLAVATGPYAGEGFDCPPLDTLFLAAPVASKGRLLQYAGRILRPYDGKATAEVHDYHDEQVGVLASSLAKRAPGYTSLGFPDPRKLPYSPSARCGPPSRPGGAVSRAIDGILT
jgi:hypothetical protein